MSKKQLDNIQYVLSMDHLSDKSKTDVIGLIMHEPVWEFFNMDMKITESTDSLLCLETTSYKNHFRVVMKNGKPSQQLHGTSNYTYSTYKRIEYYDNGVRIKEVDYDYTQGFIRTCEFDDKGSTVSKTETKIGIFPKSNKSNLKQFIEDPFHTWLKAKIVSAMVANQTEISLSEYGSYGQHLSWLELFCDFYGYKLSQQHILSWTGKFPR